MPTQAKELKTLSNRDKLADAQQEIEKRYLLESEQWKKAWNTPDGLNCLALLKDKFYDLPMLAHSDPTVTQNNAAQRDVVQYILLRLKDEAP